MTKKNIDLNALNGKKIYIATPMYGGLATAQYIMSITELNKICIQNNIELSFGFIANESLVTRARNVLVSGFLKTNCDYLFFIDADINFNPEDFLYMIHEAITKKIDVISAAYPQKTIAWEMIEKARKNNLITNEKDYLDYAGIYGINFEEKEQTVDLNELVEVKECSTGFMLISKNTFIKFKEFYPEKYYISDQHDDKEEKFAYFDTEIDKETMRYLSEDYMFCKYIKKIGIKVWLAPWIKLEHVGTNIFTGSYISFLQNMNK